MARQAPAGSARRRWTVAWIVRVAFVVAVAAAVWAADRVFDSAWIAAAAGCLVLTTPWTAYLFVTHRRSGAGSATRGRAAPRDRAPAAPDDAAARRAAYRKVRQDLFPLASRPEQLARPFAGAREAWERSRPVPSAEEPGPDDESAPR